MTKPFIPSLSVIVPVHNEEGILDAQVQQMVAAFRKAANPFELLLVENGSTDHTPALCRQLAQEIPEVRVFTLPVGDYGNALREGILRATGEIAVIFNIEFWSMEFVGQALKALTTSSFVVGSKAARGAQDQRPFLRRLITWLYNRMLFLVWGFDGTDTHGMKAFWRAPLLPIVEQCVTKGWIFDTELVLRVQKAELTRAEVPTDVVELRAPSYTSLARRIPSVLGNLWRLVQHVPTRLSA